MSQAYIKNTLKKAREAIQVKNYEEVVVCCENVTHYEPENYNAYVFLGVAYLNLNRLEESEQSYRKAIEIDATKPLAWEGLEKFYEKQKNWEKYEETLDLILQRHIESRDSKKVLETINKLTDLHKTKERNRRKLVTVLKNFLPQSKAYDLIKTSDGVPTPIQVMCEIAELLEREETEFLKREVETRRQRLNAGPLATIKTQVQNEIYLNSELEEIYENLIEAAKSEIEECSVDLKELSIKFLNHLQKKLAAVPKDRKKQLSEKLHCMARQLFAQKCTFALPYEILIESTNAGSLDDYNISLLRQYSEQFPDTALSKSIQGYLRYKDGDSVDEIIVLFNDGLGPALTFLFTYLALSWIHYDSKDYENALGYALSGCDLATQKAQEMCLILDRYERSLELIIADCYFNIGGKYYTDASRYYRKILEKDPDNLLALEGYGIVLSAQKQYNKAMEILERAQQLDPNSLSIQSEIGWVHFLLGNIEEAKRICLAVIELSDNSPLYFYRLGRIYWAMDGEYRSNKEYAYSQLIRAVQIDAHFAGAFTYLGHHYRLVGDNIRAKKCYQKAFSLDTSDEEAALYLSEYYQSENDNVLAEAVYRTIIQSNPRAGWAWKRLGFHELANNNYTDAITAFQTALRTNTKDIQCWEGLAEAYRQEGKYTASLKAFTRATELDPSSIFANYQIAAVKQKLGFFTEAIEHYKITIDKAKEKGEPDHFPSLKSCGDSYLALVREYFQTGFYGRAADSIADGLKMVVRAIQMHPETQCLWKLVGDLCMEARFIPNHLHLIPLSTLRSVIENLDPFDVNKKLRFPDEIDSIAIRGITEEEGSVIDIYAATLTCSCISYKYAIILSGNDFNIAPSYWYDLAIVYYKLYEHVFKFNQDIETSSSYLSVAIRCIKIALRLEPANSTFWNTLGVITLTTNTKISQHAFIKAIEYSQKDPVPWTNIGFLYLMNSNLELANKAFSTAQTIDPDFVPAWAGQAYVANIWGSEEALELFEHSFIISGGTYLPEANYSYAYKCFQTHLSDTSNSDSLHSPSFALQKLIELNPDDATALNLLGLILERLDQPMTASEAFTRAIQSLENSMQTQKTENIAISTKNLASAQTNLARVLCAIGDFSGSINAYLIALKLIGEEEEGEDKSSTSFRIYNQLGAGLSYYFDNQLESSLNMFEMALNGTEEGSGVEEMRRDVIVLLSQVLWALQGEERWNLAKEELFRCISQNPSHLPAIFGLCAIGLLQNDETLATAALQEMKKLPLHIAGEADELDRDHDIDFLTSRYHLLLDSPKESTLSLVKSVHATPTNLQTWIHLTNHLISTASSSSAVSSARASLKLLAVSASSNRVISTLHNAKLHQNLTAALLLKTNENDEKLKEEEEEKRIEYVTEAFYEAQRAIIMAPWDLGAWSLLGVANRTYQYALLSHQ